MTNQLVLIGRLIKEPEIVETESKKNCNVTIAVNRNYKNAEGIYETDFMDVTIWEPIANNVIEYCHKGDLIGVRGRLETRTIANNNENKTKMIIIAERITYLSTKRSENE